MNSKLKLGGIYSVKWDKRQMRIMAFDDKEVFYDCYWPEIEKWTFTGNLNKKKISFYRISAEYFISTSKLIGILNLTEEEYTLIKPNFPLRFCRIKNKVIIISPEKGIEIINDTKNENRLMWDPSHPDAIKSGDRQGYVMLPNVDLTTETVDLMATSKLYDVISEYLRIKYKIIILK